MNRGAVAIALIAAAGLLAGCAPSIVVQNKTGFGVRAVITNGGHSQVLSPSPGESSAADAEEGAYRVTVVPDREWVEWATATRRYLNDRLANSSQLTGPQLLDVVQRLKDIAAKMQQYQAAGAGASCGGVLGAEQDGLAIITTSADGGLVVTCK